MTPGIPQTVFVQGIPISPGIPWVFYLVMAFLLGGAIGMERQLHQRMAGLRTNVLVSTGAAMFCIMSYFFPVQGEVLRVPAQVVAGIGFLGAGVIMREGFSVKGLDTAATLWCSAAVGALCGMGLWRQAAVGTGLILLANAVLRPIMEKIHRLQDGQK
jgi:putative Mg2+ transporter-C (MgtC) family protein